MEIGAFLYELRRFVADGKKIFVGNETIKLLADTVDIIQDQLLTKAEVIDLPNEINMKFLQELDSDYKLYRTIMCRLCKVSHVFVYTLHFSFICDLFSIICGFFIFFFFHSVEHSIELDFDAGDARSRPWTYG